MITLFFNRLSVGAQRARTNYGSSRWWPQTLEDGGWGRTSVFADYAKVYVPCDQPPQPGWGTGLAMK